MADAAGAFNFRKKAPPCTDNFQVKPFIYEGVRYHSCEQAYQACKFLPGSDARARVVAVTPHAGESDSAHGMRCWQAGQRGEVRGDWDKVKVSIMLAVNRAKYAEHASCRAELLATGQASFKGGPSTTWRFRGAQHGWCHWNGLIQERLREELRPLEEQRSDWLADVVRRFNAYAGAGSGGGGGDCVDGCGSRGDGSGGGGVEFGCLFRGNLQAAMVTQDQAAIRAIMAHREENQAAAAAAEEGAGGA